MDKQKATDFIISRLNLDYDRIDIAADLSQRLNAPPEIVAKFVNQIADAHTPPPPEPSPQPEEDIPDWLKASRAPTPSTEFPEPTHSFSDPQTPIYENSPNELPQPSTHPFTDSMEAESELDIEPEVRETPIKPSKLVDSEALKVFVIRELKRNRRHSDVVQAVCERTNWHWNEAQRFVGRIKTASHDELTKHQNKILIPLGIAFILGGIVAVFIAADQLLGMLYILNSPAPIYTPIESTPYFVGLLVSGFGFIIGGAFGIWKALNAR